MDQSMALARAGFKFQPRATLGSWRYPDSEPEQPFNLLVCPPLLPAASISMRAGLRHRRFRVRQFVIDHVRESFLRLSTNQFAPVHEKSRRPGHTEALAFGLICLDPRRSRFRLEARIKLGRVQSSLYGTRLQAG